MKDTTFKVMACIPYINILPTGVFIIGGLVDFFRNHSEEYKKEIERIIVYYNNNIESNKEDLESYINNINDSYSKEINNIFNLFGKDSKIISQNSEILKKIIKNFEIFLKNLLNKE